MKVVAILGGLGSQMFKYAFYLALQEKTKQDCVIDTSFFAQRDCWNGYELGKLFNVKAPDLINLLDEDRKNRLINDKELYAKVAIDYLQKDQKVNYYFMGKKFKFKNTKGLGFRLLDYRRKALYIMMHLGKVYNYSIEDFINDGVDYVDEYPHNSDEHFADYKQKVIEAFEFSPFDDNKNKEVAQQMWDTESVAMHIRRSDHLADNGKLFDNGFYKKAVAYIKDKANKEMTFYLFSDDLVWCKNNLDELGLSEYDNIVLVDWNKGADSDKDMQLMTYCKHNIVPISSFSWWGYYLSKRENKIVVAPNGYWTEVPVHF